MRLADMLASAEGLISGLTLWKIACLRQVQPEPRIAGAAAD
jgi:hypothetical protein